MVDTGRQFDSQDWIEDAVDSLVRSGKLEELLVEHFERNAQA